MKKIIITSIISLLIGVGVALLIFIMAFMPETVTDKYNKCVDRWQEKKDVEVLLSCLDDLFEDKEIYRSYHPVEWYGR